MKRGRYLGLNKIQGTKKHDLKCRKVTMEGIFYIDFDKLSDKQKKMLHDLYLEYIKDGLKQKEARGKAFEIVTCFKI